MVGRWRPTALSLVVAAVCAAGAATLTWAVAAGGLHDLRTATPATIAYIACVIVGELRPIKVFGYDDDGEITLSTPFAYAVLLAAGAPLALLVLAFACALAEISARKPLQRVLFNIGNYTLSMGAAALVAWLLSGQGVLLAGKAFPSKHLAALVLSGVTYFVVNNTLTGAVLALSQGRNVWTFIRRDLFFQTFTSGVLIALAPVVVIISHVSATLIPLLLMPVAAVYRSAQTSLEKEWQSLHDVLTHLPNRQLFHDVLTSALATALETGTPLGVMLIDLDRFKEVNDTLGHQTGDDLLRQVGPRLQAAVREGDIVARLGGDEFAVLLPEVPGVDLALHVARRILVALEEPFVTGGYCLEIGASIGVAVYPDHGDDVETLVQRADVAMYMAKEAKTGVEQYAADRDPHSRERLTMLGDLRRAIEQEQLVVYYQPKADMATGAIKGVEALLRWEHPERGLLPPMDFIPLAEKTPLIGPITAYVIKKSLAQAREWAAQGLELTVAVNLPVQNLYDPDFPALVGRLLAESGCKPGTLTLELTESMVMADPRRAIEVVAHLKHMGIEMSVDDFGTGYSSLAHLQKLPVQELKIDKSFVLRMAEDHGDAMIVRSTVELARNLGLRTVAEGVETEAVWDMLVLLGCDTAQGYFISKPVPPEALTPWLLARGETTTTPITSTPTLRAV